MRALLSPNVIAAAEKRADAVATGADRVLVVGGHLRESTYLVALAASLDIAFDPLDRVPRAACPLPDAGLLESAAAGLLPLRIGNSEVLVVAPRGIAARRLVQLLRQRPELRHRFRLTSSEGLHRFVARHCEAAIGKRAANSLRKTEQPTYSAASRIRRIVLIPPVALLAAVFALAPQTGTVLGTFFATVFLAWIALRLYGAFLSHGPQIPPGHVADDELPIYSIIVALHREATAVGGLVAALRQLDYPREKLDIKLVLEPDDGDTREAVRRLDLSAPFEVMLAPASGPRTKPKALNAVLPFVRGGFVAIFDAEDRPDPDQLRRALDAFGADGEALACVQARLTIDNGADGWLAGLFTAEYAGLFDVFLPAIAARGLPLPLGGSSNHFRTAALRRIGGWDAYNVTEDADLGMRLARFAYRTDMIASSTYEEAPARLRAWLRQRTRWFKGWMQTWLVHMREPLRLGRELGPKGFAAFQLLIGGTVLSALVHPIFAAVFLVQVATGGGLSATTADGVLVSLYLSTFVGGYLVSGLLGYMGLARRGLRSTAWALVLMPFHWALLSLAAWRALFQLLTDPHGWEKTEHGLARTSRRAQERQAASIAALRARAQR